MKVAIILFNLGGPDSLEAVRPFLFNLFNDKAIISAPQPVRWLLAHLISRKRTPVAKDIYQQIGGKSPLLELTRKQASALQEALSSSETLLVKTFVAMRYWHPMSDETAGDVKKFDPDRIILLPLYPQFSTATTQSSMDDWMRAQKRAGISARAVSICCYPDNPGFIKAQADLIRNALQQTTSGVRLLFSAHGLPKKIIDAGDPYQIQVERTAAALMQQPGLAGYDFSICYQSRVGPLEWIRPSLDDELQRAAEDGTGVAVIPLAFVSEHSETLVELDIEYRSMAEDLNLPAYIRVPTVAEHPDFISGLKELALKAINAVKTGDKHTELEITSGTGNKDCPGLFGKCPLASDV